MSDLADVTEGGLLGGRVRYRQLRCGHRSGIEPVLLAAAVAAKPGEHVLEGGTGAGAALLCLAARCPAISGVGVEQDTRLAALARENLALNGLLPSPNGGKGGGADILQADLLALPALAQPTIAQPAIAQSALAQSALAQPFDHAFANPPWHGADSTASPDALRDLAKRAGPGLLAQWAAALAARLRPGGSLTLVVPAAAAAAALAALEPAGCGSSALLPLWPYAGEPARIVLVRGIRGGRGGCRVLPGLVLHEQAGFTHEARAVLWEGKPLEF